MIVITKHHRWELKEDGKGGFLVQARPLALREETGKPHGLSVNKRFPFRADGMAFLMNQTFGANAERLHV